MMRNMQNVGTLSLRTTLGWVRFMGLVLLMCISGMAFLYAQTIEQYERNSINKKFSLEEYQSNIDRHYIYGFGGIHFYMTLEEAKEKLQEAELDSGVEITEYDSDIYSWPVTIKQDFVYYHLETEKHYPFTILPTDMEEFLNKIIAKGLPTRILHLSKRYKNDFKSVVVPANVEAGRPWEVKLSFFNRRLNNTNVYRLFAISLSYTGTKAAVGNFLEAPGVTVQRIRKQLYKKYGTPEFKRSVILGKRQEVEKFYETFHRGYVSDDYRYNKNRVANYSLEVQLSATYLQIGQKVGNFQVSYVAADYVTELFPEFTSSQYNYDELDLDNDIDIKF